MVANFTLQDGTCRTCPSYDLSILPNTSWQTQSSTIGRNGCVIFRIPVPSTPGYTYTFKTGCGDGATANYDTNLELYDSNCNLLANNDNACSTLQSSITWISNYTAAAFIYVKVRGLSSTFGNFTLAFLRLDPVANYTISTSSNPAAGGNTSGGGTVSSGSSKTVTATANTGYTFTNWTENGAIVSTNASYTFTVSANRTLVANFTANAVNYTISTSSNPTAGGTTTGGGTATTGSSKTVTATANTGYTFTNWTENGTVVSTNASYTFTVSANRTLVANFTANSYTITTSSNLTAGGTTTGGGSAIYGSSKTVTAITNTGYTFTNWTENGTVVSALASYTFTLTANRTLVANFTLNPVNYTLSTSAFPTAGGTTAGGGTFVSGSSKTVTATANTGYTFANWTENGTVVSALASYTFTLSANRTLVANFTLNPLNYTISISANPTAGGTTTGSGSFVSGSSKTVTVTANTGYTFTNWTENGTVVSTLASYTFTLSAKRTLVANFILNGSLTVSFLKPSDWSASDVFIWAWSSTGVNLFSTWPGIAMTNVGNSWYNYTFAPTISAINIIFSKSGSPQTVDIIGVNQSTCYKTTGLSGAKITVASTTCPPTGFEVSNEQENNLKIFPNPAIEYVEISGLKDLTQIDIYNLSGRLISSSKLTSIVNTINISYFPEGIYIVKGFTNDGVKLGRFVKE